MERNENENGGRRKLLVPLVAIMLCAVAVVGAGYAYSSQLDLQDNTLDGAKLNVTLDETEGAKAVFTKTGASLPHLVLSQDTSYEYVGSTYTPTVKTHVMGTSEDGASSELGVLKVNYAYEAGTTVYASVKVVASSNTVGGVALDKIISGISIGNVNITNLSSGGFSNLYGTGTALSVTSGTYNVVLKINTAEITDAMDLDTVITALEAIEFTITVKLDTTSI